MINARPKWKQTYEEEKLQSYRISPTQQEKSPIILFPHPVSGCREGEQASLE